MFTFAVIMEATIKIDLVIKTIIGFDGPPSFFTSSVCKTWRNANQVVRTTLRQALASVSRATKCHTYFLSIENERCWTAAMSTKNNQVVLEWLYKNNTPWSNNRWLLNQGIISAHLCNVVWVFGKCPEVEMYSFTSHLAAAMRGPEICDILKLLFQKGCPFDSTTLNYTARSGHIPALKWMTELKCPWDKSVIGYAASENSIEAMVWLKENGYRMDCYAFSQAVIGENNLEALKLLKEMGCEWNGMTMDNATRFSSVEVMRWLKSNNCPWGPNTMNYAWNSSDPEKIRFCVEEGCPGVQLLRDSLSLF